MVPFLRYTGLASSKGDYISNYMLALTPAGFRGLMTALSMLFNPTAVGKVLSLVLLIPLLTGFALGGRRLSGRWGMLATVGLALSAAMFTERMAGGVARSFAYPVLALSAFALITGRIRWLCVLTVVGAAFYPGVRRGAGNCLVPGVVSLSRCRSWRGCGLERAEASGVVGRHGGSGGGPVVAADAGVQDLRPRAPTRRRDGVSGDRATRSLGGAEQGAVSERAHRASHAGVPCVARRR